MTVEFKDMLCKVEKCFFSTTERLALILVNDQGDPLLNCTYNVPDSDIPEDEVAVRDSGEYKGILAALRTAGIIGPPLRTVKVFDTIEAPVCRVLV